MYPNTGTGFSELAGANSVRPGGTRAPQENRYVLGVLPVGTQTSLLPVSHAMQASGRTQAKARRPIAGAALRGDIATFG